MKKLALWLSILLIVALAAAAALPWGLPGDREIDEPAQRADGALLIPENRLLSSRIYIRQSGELSGIYREPRLRGWQEWNVAAVTTDGDDSYFLRLSDDEAVWELLKLDGELAVSLYTYQPEDAVRFTGLKAGNGLVWITAVGGEDSVYTYEYKEGDLSLSLLHSAPWLKDAAAAEFDGESIRVITAQGEIAYLAPDGTVSYDNAAIDLPPVSIPVQGKSWLLCKQWVLIGALALWLVVAISLLIAVPICRKANRLAARLTAVGAEVLFLGLLAGVIGCTVLLLERLRLPDVVAFLIPAGIGAVALWLIFLVLLSAISRRVTFPIRALTRQMIEVADGRVEIQEVKPGKDELSAMDRSLQELCAGLSIRDYEMESTIRSYSRFVPQKLTQLLGRANLAEVELGDNCRFIANIGLFSVGNRSVARANLSDDAFVDFINYSFGLFQDCAAENRGCMISGGLRLSSMETLFLDAPADGVRAGLDFLGQAQKQPDGGIPAPKPMLLLHRAPILYGLAGQDDRLYPYLSSLELEYLGSYTQRFHELGARIVTTEAYWEQLSGCGFTGRYIGFISDGEKRCYKLYEILDAYPELERNLRASYDRRFQEAINLFYHDDFFLARNLFSTLLRACPEDGIARWYLFACEHFFNQEGVVEADYRLFGIDEL